MKQFLPLATVLVLGVACTPDIAQDNNGPTGDAIYVQFDPAAKTPVLPLPNDIVGHDPTTKKLTIPKQDSDSPAQAEFNSVYLNSLDGFPFESTGTVDFSGELRADTVNGTNVLVYDLGLDGKGTPAPVTIAPTYVGKRVSIPPPGTGWTRGHHYAVALVGGDNGLRGASNQAVLGTATFGLLSSKFSLVTCPDLKTNCRASVDIIPSQQTDPAAKIAEQTAIALQLESSRVALAPTLDFLETQGKPREVIPMAWTFTIVDSAEVTFDPSHNTIPFPNDILRDPTTKKVTLPNPKTFAPITAADCASATEASVQLVCGLNTLDGFSTIAPPVSENSATAGVLSGGKLDPKSLSAATIGLAKISMPPTTVIGTDVNFTPCIDCQSSKDPTTGAPLGPQTLQWSLNAPLDEQTQYLAWTTGELKDEGGKNAVAAPTFALLRLVNPLVTTDGKSAVSILSDDQAKQLEPLRAALKPAIDGLDSKGIKRENLTLAFAFTTQSEGSILDTIHGLIAGQAPTALPDVPLPPPTDATPAGLTFADITPASFGTFAKLYETNLVTPLAVTGPSGTLDPANPKPKLIAVDVIVPTAAPTGLRVNVFGHGFTRSRNDALALAAKVAIADNQIIVMMDWLDHGNDRSSCTGSKLATGFVSDDQSCIGTQFGGVANKCDNDPLQGLCVLADAAAVRNTCTRDIPGDLACLGAGQGYCAADLKCQGNGGRFLQDNDLPTALGGVPGSNRPVISGWNIFNLSNFFATRDNFRQAVIDFTQLVRVIKSTSPGNFNQRLQASLVNSGVAATALPIDTTKIGYVGQSLGGILGTLVTAVSPDVDNVVLNVPGGALPQIVLNASDSLVGKLKAGLLAGLKAQGIEQGTPEFDQFIGFAQWIVDPADPTNLGYRVTHPINGAPPASRKAFIQFIQGDPTVPNIANFALVAGANRTFNPAAPPGLGCVAPLSCYEFTEAGDAFDANTAAVSSRHGFLLAPPAGSAGAGLTTKAQLQASTFLKTGALP